MIMTRGLGSSWPWPWPSNNAGIVKIEIEALSTFLFLATQCKILMHTVRFHELFFLILQFSVFWIFQDFLNIFMALWVFKSFYWFVKHFCLTLEKILSSQTVCTMQPFKWWSLWYQDFSHFLEIHDFEDWNDVVTIFQNSNVVVNSVLFSYNSLSHLSHKKLSICHVLNHMYNMIWKQVGFPT